MTLRVRSGPLWLLVVLVIAVVAAAFAAPAIAAQSVPEVTPPDATYSYDLDTSSTTPSATLALDGLRVYGSSAPRSRSRTSSIALSRAAEDGMAAVRAAGQEGESLSGIVKNTDRIPVGDGHGGVSDS
jgi:hypothetical protein